MNRLIQVAEALHAAGAMSRAQLRQIQIHQSYWVLRTAGVRPTVAMAQVSVAFQVAEDTVQVYTRDRARFDVLLQILSSD